MAERRLGWVNELTKHDLFRLYEHTGCLPLPPLLSLPLSLLCLFYPFSQVLIMGGGCMVQDLWAGGTR